MQAQQRIFVAKFQRHTPKEKEFEMAAVKSITSPMKFLIQAGLLADLGNTSNNTAMPA